MALTEAEELELLELEAEAARSSAPAPPAPSAQEPVAAPEALFPRSMAAREKAGGKYTPRESLAAIADVYSLPGRALAALPALAKGGESYPQSLARTQAKPQQGAGKIGQLAGDVVRSPTTPLMALGGGAAAPIAKTAATAIGKPVLGKIAQLGIEGAGMGAGGYAGGAVERAAAGQMKGVGGEIGQAAIDISVGGVTNPLLPGVAKTVGKLAPKELGKAMQNAANRMENTKIKILSSEQKMGAKQEYFGKYGLFGNAQKVHENAQQQIQTLAKELKDKLETATFEPNNKVNVYSVFAKAGERLSGEGLSEAEKATNKAAWAKVTGQLQDVYEKSTGGSGDVDLLEALLLKRYVGKYGDWLSSPGGGIRPSPEASVEARVYNTVYDELKKQLEQKGGEGIKEINKAMSELIPMERAAGKRLLVESRKNPISLDDFIGGLAVAGSAAHGNLLPAAMATINVASKSPNIAKGLYGLGGVLQKGAPTINSMAAGAGAGAGAGAAVSPEGERGKGALVGAGLGAAGAAALPAAARMARGLGNKGSVGGLPERFQDMKPAIRSPITGKIYDADKPAFGHKQIFNQLSKEEPAAEKQVWKALFDDNSGAGSPYIGFIDKNGKFISRIDAEKQIEMLMPSLVGQYHEAGNTALPMLGLTAAGATGALAGGGAIERAMSKRNKDEQPAAASGLRGLFANNDMELDALRHLSKKELAAIARISERR